MISTHGIAVSPGDGIAREFVHPGHHSAAHAVVCAVGKVRAEGPRTSGMADGATTLDAGTAVATAVPSA